ncbi:M15 family metallopeptidase [Deinococcus pimensis]|uniref:M15 family metallopeptidase n=1 Tax=Deinococcus pimensis TaxID=309888 RepID=UPI0004AE304C|nr:M15 family metallopeptidase [Deinococcus pimensis]
MDQLLYPLRGALLGLAALTHVSANPIAPAASNGAQRLVEAYPAFLERVDGNDVVWRDGTRMPFEVGRTPASYVERLDHADLADQMSVPYPSLAPITPPAWNVDPGRMRFEPLFEKMYGASSGEVQRNLVGVAWFGQTLLFSKVNGADRALALVAADVAKQPELLAFVRPSAGTFVWRTIAGSSRRSTHAYGIAIDVNTRVSDYWRWSGAKEGARGLTYRNRVPLALVRIFERHGFVWGGRWYHYDTMHFEYRPELAAPHAN